MLRVRLDDYVADGTAHLDEAPTAEHDATGAHPAGKPRPAGELHFNQVVAILRRRSPLILTIAGLGTVLAIVVGLLIPPKYTAVAQLVIEPPAGSAAERAPGVSAMDELIDTHVTLLSSRDHLQRVIESLSQDPESGLAVRNTADPAPTTGAISGALKSAALDQPTGSTATETTGLNELKRRLNVWLAVLRRSASTAVPLLEEFDRNTRVIQERRSRVISVGYTSTSPEKAAAFANRIVQLYVDSLTPAQLIARGQALDTAHPTYYAVSVTRGLDVQLVRVVNGRQTVLGDVKSKTWVSGQWLQVSLVAKGNQLRAQVFRTDTGQYLNADGTWGLAPTWALVRTDTAITRTGYAGLGRGAGRWIDGTSISSSSSSSSPSPPPS